MPAFPPEVSELDRAELESEVARLRRLVGPSERDYEERLAELERASLAVRRAEEANGELRGELARAERDLGRLRESQGRIHRLVIHRARRAVRAVASTARRVASRG